MSGNLDTLYFITSIFFPTLILLHPFIFHSFQYRIVFIVYVKLWWICVKEYLCLISKEDMQYDVSIIPIITSYVKLLIVFLQNHSYFLFILINLFFICHKWPISHSLLRLIFSPHTPILFQDAHNRLLYTKNFEPWKKKFA